MGQGFDLGQRFLSGRAVRQHTGKINGFRNPTTVFFHLEVNLE